jgi:hypothetical protein
MTMLVVMNQQATPDQIEGVVAAIEKKGYTARPIPGGERVAIGVLHNKGPMDKAFFLSLPGVKDAIPVTKPFKLVSRELQSDDTVVRVGDVVIGGENLTFIAGPCAVESEEQAHTIARLVRDASKFSRRFEKKQGCPWLQRRLIISCSIWWSNMPIWCRSVPETCKTTAFYGAQADHESPSF